MGLLLADFGLGAAAVTRTVFTLRLSTATPMLEAWLTGTVFTLRSSTATPVPEAWLQLFPLPGEAAPGFVGCTGGSETDYNQVSACGFLCLRPPSSPNWIFSTKKSPFWVMFTWQGFGWSSWLITNERESYFLPSLCIIYSVIFQSVSGLIHHKSLCRLQKW